MACFEAAGKVGFINKAGSTVIQPQFDAASRFENGIAAVAVDMKDKWGYIDKAGKYVWQPTE